MLRKIKIKWFKFLLRKYKTNIGTYPYIIVKETAVVTNPGFKEPIMLWTDDTNKFCKRESVKTVLKWNKKWKKLK